MGDYVRWSPPYVEGAEDSAKSALFLSLNRNKRSIRIDLKSDAGREVLLRLAREHDVLLESFRPGVLDRLGVGYERLKQENPGLVYCAITGYGQDGPKRDARRPRHELPRRSTACSASPARPDGPPIQAAGQIADLGGGALMAAVGILAALRERERSGEGQLVDVSMFDGALSWLAMVAARDARRRADAAARPARCSPARSLCYRPYACSDGWVTLGALEPKFWQAWCRGVGREDLIEQQFAHPAPRPRAVEAVFPRARAPSGRRSRTEHDCCLEPVLELDEALDSELVRAREMVVELEQPGRGGSPSSCSACRSSSPARPATRRARPVRRSASTPTRCCAEAGYGADEIAALKESGRGRRPPVARPPPGASWQARRASGGHVAAVRRPTACSR